VKVIHILNYPIRDKTVLLFPMTTCMKPQENFSGHHPKRNPKKPVTSVSKDKDDFLKVTSLIDLLYDVLDVYGYDNEPNLGDGCKTYLDKIRLRDRYLEFVKLSGFGSWKDLFKYKINAFFSSVMGQEIPPAPKNLYMFPDLLDPRFLVFGRAKRYLSYIRKNRDLLISFAQTIAQSKKGAPPVHPDVVAAAELKTFTQLTSEPVQGADSEIFDGVWNVPINRSSIEFELRRTVNELRWSELTIDDLTKPFFPSTSAQYNWGRKHLGAVASVVHECLDEFSSNLPDVLIDKKLGRVDLSDPYSGEYGKIGLEENTHLLKDSLENGIFQKETVGLHFDSSRLHQHWKNYIFPQLLEKAMLEEPRTLCIGLPEPLKVRTITAGPSLTYTVLKPVQKWLWRNLKEHECFRLIGEPITSEIVSDCLGKVGDEEELISGDYVASTDNLHSWVSECLADEVILMLHKHSSALGKELIDKIGILIKRALTKHLILHPKFLAQYRKDCQDFNMLEAESVPANWFVEQKEGQLMGSIISFPFLCLANAAACRFSMEISSGKTIKLNPRTYKYGYIKGSIRALFNGDDCALVGRSVEFDGVGKPALFPTWRTVTAFIGLSSSVGKTFRSKDFITMNSEQYSYSNRILSREEFDSGAKPFTYNLVKYCNFGLVYGQAKDGVRAKGSNRMGPLHHDLFDTCPGFLFERASAIFLRHNRKAINAYDIPKYVPEWLGGLGLKPTRNRQILESELLVAGLIKGNIGLVSCKELTKFHAPQVPREPREWLMHQLTKDFIKDYEFLGTHTFNKVILDNTVRDLKSESKKLYTSLIMEVYLRYGLSVLGKPSYKKIFDKSETVVSVPGGYDTIVQTFQGSFTNFHNSSKIHKTYRHNERLWVHYKELIRTDDVFAKSICHLKPTREEIRYQKIESFIPCFDVRAVVPCEVENWYCRSRLNLDATGSPTFGLPNFDISCLSQ